MRVKKGDILVCSTLRTETTGYNLTVGDKYEVISEPRDWNTNPNYFSNVDIDVKNLKTGREHRWVPDRL